MGVSPKLILSTGLGVLVLAWIGVFLVDAVDLFGTGSALYDLLHRRHSSRAWLWVLLFTEGGPIEMLQWLILAMAAGLAFHIHGRLHLAGTASKDAICARAFWLIMGIAFLLMLVEDTGNARHWIRALVRAVFGGRSGEITEWAYFIALGAVPLTALVFFSRPILRMPKTRMLLLGGFFCYGLAVAGSVTRYRWYETAGHWLHVNVFRESLKIVEVGNHGHGFWLMDYLVEESIELIGATLLAATAAAFLREYHAFLPGSGKSSDNP